MPSMLSAKNKILQEEEEQISNTYYTQSDNVV